MTTKRIFKGNKIVNWSKFKLKCLIIKLKIEYDGTNFVGWQIQKNGKSIQSKIEKALKKVLKTKIKINGAGRTDKGVHAFISICKF